MKGGREKGEGEEEDTAGERMKEEGGRKRRRGDAIGKVVE